ncbi:MAG TPA: 2OG-Fe(II) oxygenase, partial [Rhizobiales bacterium]|nr:2OG-Fe(II) oxygenase [Hyphomicrobiales bacterium]
WEGAQEIRPGSPHRDWRDSFPDKHPYRCLPMAIANNTGWELVCPTSFVIRWNGGRGVEDITFECEDDYPHFERFAASHFSHGIVTFPVDYIFRTPPGWNLWVCGPTNFPRDGIFALNGVVETDWLPYTFTMNYMLTRPGEVRFRKGEPYCYIVPVRAHEAARIQPEILDLADNPDLAERHELWAGARAAHQARVAMGDEEAIKKAWQRFYFHGKGPDGWRPDVPHAHKRRMKKPVFARPGMQTPQNTETKIHAETGEAPDHPDKAVQTLASAMQKMDEMKQETQICPVHGKGAKDTKTQKSKGAVKLEILGANAADDDEAEQRSIPPDAHFKSYRLVSEQEEAADFYLEPDFLSPEQCDAVVEAYRRHEDQAEASITEDNFFSGRFLWISSLPEEERYIKRLMNDVRARAAQRLMAFYKLEKPVFADTIQIVKWPAGFEMPAHADNAHPDGSAHATPFRDYTSLVYLNDDFEGGEFYFDNQKVQLRPKKGLLVCFTGGMKHFHGVGKVLSGERFTMPAWYSDDLTHMDPSYRDLF